MINTFVLSIIVAMFVGGAAGYLGSLMITKKMALVGDALGHVALPGMGLAILAKVDPSLGALAFLAIGVLLIWNMGEKTLLSMETLVGIVFVSSLAIGFLIVPDADLLETLIGDISKLTFAGAMASIAVSILTVLLVRRIYSGLMLLNISADLAEVEGISARKYNFLYLSAIALIVAVGVRVTGSLLVGALVIVPPATARVLGSNLKVYAGASILIGGISGILGVLASRPIHVPPGPSIILVNALLFALSLFLARLKRQRLESNQETA